MAKITYITPEFAVCDALTADDFGGLRAMGFASIVSNRPDGEVDGQMSGREEAVHAWRNGLVFRHVPADKLGLFSDQVVEGMEEALNGLPGPVLAHCASGLRSAIVWAAASARSRPVDCVVAALDAAGFDLDFIRDDLEAQADRKRWMGAGAAALDCAPAIASDPGERAVDELAA